MGKMDGKAGGRGNGKWRGWADDVDGLHDVFLLLFVLLSAIRRRLLGHFHRGMCRRSVPNFDPMEEQNDVNEECQVEGDLLDALEIPGQHIQQGTSRTTGTDLLGNLRLVHLLGMLLLLHRQPNLQLGGAGTTAAKKRLEVVDAGRRGGGEGN